MPFLVETSHQSLSLIIQSVIICVCIFFIDTIPKMNTYFVKRITEAVHTNGHLWFSCIDMVVVGFSKQDNVLYNR